MTDLHPNCKVWIFSDANEGVFGDGKVLLLREIQRQGSLREAATSLKISYRKAWGDLKKAEACLQIKLIHRRRGGKGGGQTELTTAGHELVTAYEQFRSEMEGQLHSCYSKHLGRILR